MISTQKFTYSFQDKNYINHGRTEAFENDKIEKPGIEKIVAVPL